MANPCCFDREAAEEELALLKEMLAEMRAAWRAIVVGGSQSYTINTGQTTQTVTKLNVSSMRLSIQALQNEIRMLEHQLCGGASRYFRPGF